MNPRIKTRLKGAAAILVAVIAYGIGGSDDLEEALAQEAYICQHHQPAPSYCHDR
jgi:hypothetical protein